MDTRNIISYYELSEAWQREAQSNLDSEAENHSYLEPLENTSPVKHILWDLSECMSLEPNTNGGYNASIPISNNSAMLLKIDDNYETADIKIV